MRCTMSIDPNNNGDDNDSINDTNASTNENEDTTSSLEEKIDAFLDKPFFDPNESNNWFANLVKNDYYTAESLYVGVIVIFGVILSQEMLRIVKYGGFSSGSGGKLF